ncbi:heavy metal translocating P-type ATPase [Paenibacillus harenae]|uniref:heavy metal translocating P-type ATPase n=1 Tax=Paenibacillus harenae TaxID=306543 RepID=UPI00278DF847|nr:cation-translocating P-type ATPase [Paenibacillus harenae]MDQ0059776.1 Cu+-exporting ATPase [Paenibacillus harenae]
MRMSSPDNGMMIDFAVQGMSCSACAARIEKSVGKMEGVHEAAVSFPLRTAWVQFSPEQVSPGQIAERVSQLGFTASLSEHGDSGLRKEHAILRLRLIGSLLLTLPLLLTMIHHLPILVPLAAYIPSWLTLPWLQLALATVLQFVIGMPFYFGAYYALRQKSANMDVLVAVGTTAAYLYSHYIVFQHDLFGASTFGAEMPALYFETSAVVITAVLLGKYIEASASLKANLNTAGYVTLQSQTAMVERAGQITKLRTEFVRAGDTVIVEPGELVPVDGTVISGESSVDEALLTGESTPVAKREGDNIWAGTRNVGVRLRIWTVAAGHDTLLSRIGELVRQAQRSKSSIQRNVDAAAGWFVPLMLLLAALTFLLWILVLDPGNWSRAFVSSIAVMLAACPCALGLAAPISLVLASGRLAKQGIVAKEAGALERLALIDTVIFDKTGTLTEGKPRVSALQPLKGSRSSALRLAAAAESASSHPLAAAIRQEAAKTGLVIPMPDSQVYTPGGGVVAVVNKQQVGVGNAGFAKERGWLVSEEGEKFAKSKEAAGETVLFIAINDECVAMIALIDSVKSDARSVVSDLRSLGVSILLATGDREAPARAAAKAAGITEVHASMLPEAKQSLVERLKKRGKRVAMAGDGWNDAPALASSDVGIAMGNGTEAALTAGHLSLLNSRLLAIPGAIRISRLTLRNVRQNLAFAFLYNVVIIPFAALGMLKPWMAGTAMALSSVSVVGNALRLGGQIKREERRRR